MSRITSRRRSPARHSKILARSLRIPIPAWECGVPNACVNSNNANQVSACSLFGSSRSARRAWGRTITGLFNFFARWIFDSDESAFPFRLLIIRLAALLEPIQLCLGHSVILPRVLVINLANLHRMSDAHFYALQRNDCSAGDDSHIFAMNGIA